ncbi:MAG: hypothetical protein ABIQ16_25175 [Polyangiaceae bacterium]
MRLGRWVCVAALGVCACSGSDDSASSAAGTQPCAPLDPVTSSVSLDATTVLAAGRSADGTLFVLRDVENVVTLFVATSDTLVEVPEAGTGEGHEGDVSTYVFDYEDEAGAPVSVQLRQEGADSRMSVLHGPKPDKIWDIDSEGEELSLIDAQSAVKLPAFSTRTFRLDYEGARENADALVLIAPEQAGSYDDFRLFWGAPARLSERKIQSVSRARSIGGPTNVTFAADTGSAVLSYSFPFPPTADALSTGALMIGNESEPLIGAAPPVLPDGAQFFCR